MWPPHYPEAALADARRAVRHHHRGLKFARRLSLSTSIPARAVLVGVFLFPATADDLSNTPLDESCAGPHRVVSLRWTCDYGSNGHAAEYDSIRETRIGSYKLLVPLPFY